MYEERKRELLKPKDLNNARDTTFFQTTDMTCCD